MSNQLHVSLDFARRLYGRVATLEIKTCLTIAHLDHNSGNNEHDNLAYLCWTHHWMFDADFYPIELSS